VRPREDRRGRWPSRALALGLSLAILAMLLSRVSPEEALGALAMVGPWPVLATVAVALIDGLLVDVDKFRRLLSRLGIRCSFREVATLSIPATALGGLAPAQAEEFWKARQLQRLLGGTYSEAMGLVALDRGINFASHLVLGGGALASLWLGAGCPWSLAAGVGVAYGLALGGMGLLSRLAGRVPADRHPRSRAFTGGLRRSSPGLRARILAYACASHLALSGCLWWMAIAGGAQWTLSEALVWRAASVLASKVPVSLGGIGVREGVLALGLSRAIPASVAVPVGLLHGLLTGLLPPLAALGFRSWFRETAEGMLRDLGRLTRVRQGKSSEEQDTGGGSGLSR